MYAKTRQESISFVRQEADVHVGFFLTYGVNEHASHAPLKRVLAARKKLVARGYPHKIKPFVAETGAAPK